MTKEDLHSIQLTNQQTKVFQMTGEGDCLIDTGRRWGKTYIAVALSAHWSLKQEPVNVMVIEPNHQMRSLFIDNCRTLFPNAIERVNYERNTIILRNKKVIRVYTPISDCNWHHTVFDDFGIVIIDEYAIIEQPRLKEILLNIPKNVIKCFLGTPTDDTNTFVTRKWMFNSDSFHFYRFPTPEEFFPENIRMQLHNAESEFGGYIPADPTVEYVNSLERAVACMERNIQAITNELTQIKFALSNIDRYTLR